MECHALNINPHEIKVINKLHDYNSIFFNNYTFLDNIHTFSIQKYYQLILSKEVFKLKNLYNFLFLRSLKLNTRFSTKKMEKNKYIQTSEEFDKTLYKYIQEDKLYSIIIMNGIQQFFIPLNL